MKKILLTFAFVSLIGANVFACEKDASSIDLFGATKITAMAKGTVHTGTIHE